jgi:hypothetical protein
MLSGPIIGEEMIYSAATVAKRHDVQAPAMNMMAVAASSTALATPPPSKIWMRAK